MLALFGFCLFKRSDPNPEDERKFFVLEAGFPEVSRDCLEADEGLA